MVRFPPFHEMEVYGRDSFIGEQVGYEIPILLFLRPLSKIGHLKIDSRTHLARII